MVGLFIKNNSHTVKCGRLAIASAERLVRKLNKKQLKTEWRPYTSTEWINRRKQKALDFYGWLRYEYWVCVAVDCCVLFIFFLRPNNECWMHRFFLSICFYFLFLIRHIERGSAYPQRAIRWLLFYFEVCACMIIMCIGIRFANQEQPTLPTNAFEYTSQITHRASNKNINWRNLQMIEIKRTSSAWSGLVRLHIFFSYLP